LWKLALLICRWLWSVFFTWTVFNIDYDVDCSDFSTETTSQCYPYLDTFAAVLLDKPPSNCAA
jgi:hypothetical protein